MNWKRTLGQSIRHLSKEQAVAIFGAINSRNQAQRPTIEHPEIRRLTGGYASQTINFIVMRKLAVKAGVLKQ